MTMNSNDINWKDYILPVAQDIFGEPTSQSNDMIRFGAKGSKVININSGTFYDHENGVGGGCVDLLRHYYPDEKPISVLQERYGLEQNPQNASTPPAQSVLLAQYDYTDEKGRVLYQKLRMEPKDFRWKSDKGYTLNGVERVPYALHELTKAGNKFIFLCEGEKDADTMRMRGLIATTFGGASDMPDECMPYFKDKRVFIVGDYDKAGMKRVRELYGKLKPIAKVVKHCWLEGQGEHCNDITDWFDSGHTVETLKQLVKKCPENYEEMELEPNYRFMSYDDIMTMQPPKFLVDGFLQENSLAMIWGHSGSYKSFVALDFALCIATGKDFHGSRVSPGTVLYVAAEGSSGFKNRTTAWYEHYQKKIDNFYLIPMALDINEERTIDDLLMDVSMYRLQPKLLIIDTLARCSAGSEENSATEMSKIINNLDKFREATGATCMIVHHSGKSGSQYRGSSAIYAAMDTSIQVAKDDLFCTLTSDKMKDCEPFEQMQFEMQKIDFLGGQSLVATIDENPSRMNKHQELLDLIAKMLLNGDSSSHADVPKGQLTVTRSDLREQALELFDGLGSTKAKNFSKVLEKLMADNKVLFAGSAKGKQYLWLPKQQEENTNQF